MMKHILSILISLSLLSLYAYHSDPFPLGSYSFLQNDNGYFSEHQEELIAYMKDLGYNINIIQTTNSDHDLGSLLSKLDRANIDAILADKCWSNDPTDSRHFSIVPLTTSNYQRFEAEFSGPQDVKPGDNRDPRFWYGNSDTIKRVGRVQEDMKASYARVWHLDREQDQAGWAYTDINYRWRDRSGNWVKLYDEMRFHKRHLDAKSDTDSLYLTYRIKISDIPQDLPLSAPLLSFQIYGHLGAKSEFGKPTIAVKDHQGQRLERTFFTLADYQAMGEPEGYFDLHFNISYNDLRASKIMTDDLDNNPDTAGHWWWYVMRHFAPGLYWHKNCDLSLDYIDLEDQLHRDLRTNYSFYKKGINDRIRAHLNLPGGKIIRYLYAMDEPFQTHLASFELIQNMITADNPPLCSATYDIDHRTYKQDGKDNYWNFPDLTRAIAKPRIMMPDIYPIQPKLSYSPSAGENFLQNVFDHRLIKGYRDAKNYVLEDPSREFQPIVQAFGYWNGQRWVSWTLPPAATQKALLYMPFCYGADGIHQYQLQGFINSKRAGYYSALMGVDNSYIERNDYCYEVLKAANPRILFFGQELVSWNWMGATTVMLDKSYPKLDLSGTGIAKFRVKPACNGSYEGYIETALYKNSTGQYAIFAVNRRTNEFISKRAHRNPDFTAPEDYASAYPEFAPQTLRIYLDKDNAAYALMNMETNKLYHPHRRKIEVQIPAGEAALLLLVPDTDN
ncbi:MAG: hypothetical protein PWP64_856 [Candidatus Cloacimonadota bacterium]|nr:hypothetical protein [Candidatus Cloacimonadota bacterium]